jgi:selenocysteine lyase/cysteine desulfurase
MDPDDGVVRVSMVHYNTVDEVQKLVEVLDRVLTDD